MMTTVIKSKLLNYVANQNLFILNADIKLLILIQLKNRLSLKEKLKNTKIFP